MELEFSVNTRMVVDGVSSELQMTEVQLTVDGRLDKNKFFNPLDEPTKAGFRTCSNVLVQGLINNINAAHERGGWDKDKQLEYVIEELKRGFDQVVGVSSHPNKIQNDNETIIDNMASMIAEMVEIIEATLPTYEAHAMMQDDEMCDRAWEIINQFRK